ncbi:ladderlectin-like [Nematolebias whitei]|uniref:ladderlectin-like n=1 Tax=Nematolebias whitei TaxID=451745 RepID=UPI00189771D0|nr:ladderlectin-like [Nematolebias whitei]
MQNPDNVVGGKVTARQDYCVNYYGHLASFHDQDEYDFIRSLIVGATGTNTTAWVGGTKGKDGVWKWSDRSEFSYTHWGKGEPNNLGEQENCMAINMNGQDYVSDEVCSHKHAFVCS